MFGLFVLLLLNSIKSNLASYVLEDDYSPDVFFSMFDFFTDPDPTHGYVKYVDQDTCQSMGLINNHDTAVTIGVDATTIAGGTGRYSVRITSKKQYTNGLFVLDLAHMPGGACGTWPAFWTVGPDWPTYGEIDIIEGVNSATHNAMTLHTSSNYTISANVAFSGKVVTPDCAIDALEQEVNEGCQIDLSDARSFGQGFNENQGGVYAMQWTNASISVWFFARGEIPDDVSGTEPEPLNWGIPSAVFSNAHDLGNDFQDHQIVFDVSFCGDWAGSDWSADQVCSGQASCCEDYVKNNPSAFADVYWEIKSLKVYQQDTTAPTTTGHPQSATMTTTSLDQEGATSFSPISTLLPPRFSTASIGPWSIVLPENSSTPNGSRPAVV